MMSRQSVFVITVIGALLVAAAYATLQLSERNHYKNSDAAQTLGTDETNEYTSLTGEPVSLADFEGTVRIVNSWASWSPLSRAELLELEKLGSAYSTHGVNIIAINRNEDSVRAQRFLEQLGSFEHITFLMDGTDAFYARMDGKAMPETLVFDRQGNVVVHLRGDVSYEQMVTYVEAALAAE